jgi:hypothetical protein
MGTRAVGLVATFLLASPATARVWLVCNSSSYPCPRGAAYKTISSAIARAGPGDWVLVWPGVYHGFFGNPTNADLANESTSDPKNCFDGKTDAVGLSSDPPDIQSPSVDGPPCDAPGPGDSGALLGELACAAGAAPCPPGSSYPQPTEVRMLPLDRQTPMPDPCQGVPRNPWCPYTGPRS